MHFVLIRFLGGVICMLWHLVMHSFSLWGHCGLGGDRNCLFDSLWFLWQHNLQLLPQLLNLHDINAVCPIAPWLYPITTMSPLFHLFLQGNATTNGNLSPVKFCIGLENNQHKYRRYDERKRSKKRSLTWLSFNSADIIAICCFIICCCLSSWLCVMARYGGMSGLGAEKV